MATPNTGSITVGQTATALVGTSTLFSQRVKLVAGNQNTGRVYVGLSSAVTAASAAATDGFELGAGQVLDFPPAALALTETVLDLANIWVIASAASQKVFWIAW